MAGSVRKVRVWMSQRLGRRRRRDSSRYPLLSSLLAHGSGVGAGVPLSPPEADAWVTVDWVESQSAGAISERGDPSTERLMALLDQPAEVADALAGAGPGRGMRMLDHTRNRRQVASQLLTDTT